MSTSHVQHDSGSKWRNFTSVGLVMLPWFVAAAGDLALKYFLLRHRGFHESALALPSGTLTVWEKVALFRSDLLLGLVLIPLALCALTHFFPLRWRIAISSVVAIITGVAVGLEFAAYDSTGAFASLKLIWAAVGWMVANHDTGVVSVPLRGPVLLVVWMATIAATSVLAVAAARRANRALSYACLLAFALGSVATAVASVPKAHELAWSPSLLGFTANALFERSADEVLLARSTSELLDMYRQTAHVPAADPGAFHGRARGYNVVLLVMEAMPAEVLDVAKDPLADMPNLQRLRKHAFVAERHYTTLPATNLATFALFTSMYSKTAAGEVIGEREMKLPGLVRSLKEEGYRSGFYGFVWKTSSQRDDRMLASFGFDNIVVPTAHQERDRDGAETFTGAVSHVLERDREVLAAMRRDIARWTEQSERFVAAYFPQLSHDPWRSLPGSQVASAMERGRALAAYQDAWLGNIVEELERHGALENTIIILTADHGVRKLPAEKGKAAPADNVVSDNSIHVPFILYAPKIVDHTVRISAPTSHVDVMPTVLDLLGVSGGRHLEQGSAVWNSNLSQRRVFTSTLGSAEFVDGGGYYMRSSANTVFAATSPQFSDKDALPFKSEKAAEVRQIFDQHDKVQQALMFHVLGSRNVR